MIPCVSGKCITRFSTSTSAFPSLRAMLPVFVVPGTVCVATLTALRRRRRRRRLPGLFGPSDLGRELRHLRLDLLEPFHVADLAAPVGLREPAVPRAGHRAEATRLVAALRVQRLDEWRVLRAALVVFVRAAWLEAASRRR